jgi:hypothetical protein
MEIVIDQYYPDLRVERGLATTTKRRIRRSNCRSSIDGEATESPFRARRASGLGRPGDDGEFGRGGER